MCFLCCVFGLCLLPASSRRWHGRSNFGGEGVTACAWAAWALTRRTATTMPSPQRSGLFNFFCLHFKSALTALVLFTPTRGHTEDSPLYPPLLRYVAFDF
ncbi:unnamed protein product [Ectocarpus sp. 12 AP-2014]